MTDVNENVIVSETDETVPAFRVFWSSFGLGVNDAFDPGLASALEGITKNYSYSRKDQTLYMSVEVDAARSDLSLIEKFDNNSAAKEVIVYLRDCKKSLVFTIVGLKEANISDHLDYHKMGITNHESAFVFNASMAIKSH